jgi:pSer/pThr/pTyr-binding forkhead associated (FHA) protein
MITLYGDPYLLLIAAAIVAACLAALMLLRASRRPPTPTPGPQPSSIVPYLESPDGRLRLPLARLTAPGVTIGSSISADLRVDSTLPDTNTVSDQHARIYRDASTGCVMIEDLSSAAGVYINGRRAPHKNMLRDRWIIGLGSVKLVYRDGHSDTGPME